MILTLLSHQWKSFWRGRGVAQSVALQIFTAFIILYLLATCLIVGVELSHFLPKLFPGQDILKIYCGFILYYFVLDIVLRFIFQELPVLSTQPYLSQNIRRRQIVTYLNVKSLFHFLNLLPLLIFLPFVFTKIFPIYGTAAGTAFTLSILLFTCFNHFAMLYIKRKAYLNIWWFVGLLGFILLLIAFDYWHILSASTLSVLLFTNIIHHPWLVMLPLVMAILAYINNWRFLKNNLYLEELQKKQSKRKQSTDYTWLKQWGMTGELAGLDIRLIFRNKRARATALVSLFFAFYGLVFYQDKNLHPFHYGILLLPGLFMTGLFLINYGRFTFAWYSSCFDGLMASNLPIVEFIRSKFLLFSAVSTLIFILISFYGLLDWRIIPIQAAAWLYNMGCNSVLAIWFCTYSYKAIDISKSNSFNYQGGGTANFIYSFATLLIPYAIYLPFVLTGHPWSGIIALGALGLVSFLFRNWWIEVLTKEFYKRKHLILEGFREK